jgi:hypothetical protein
MPSRQSGDRLIRISRSKKSFICKSKKKNVFVAKAPFKPWLHEQPK